MFSAGLTVWAVLCEVRCLEGRWWEGKEGDLSFQKQVLTVE